MAENSTKPLYKSKEKCFIWTDDLTRVLLDLLSDYQRENGKNGFSWKHLTDLFEQKTNMKCKKDTLKNKYNNLRSVWKLWLNLKHGETGLGWDYEKQCISATPEWWSQKLQENEEYRVFKKNAFNPEMESIMELLFHGTIATGSHCVAPSMAPTVVIPNALIQDLTGQNDDTVPAEYVDELLRDATIDEFETPFGGSPANGDFLSCPLPSRGKGKKRIGNNSSPGVGKRNVRKSTGSSLYQDNLAASLQVNKAMATVLEAEANSVAQGASSKAKHDYTEALDIIALMVDEGFISQGSSLWCFAVSLVGSVESQRALFTQLPNNEGRLSWLKWEFRKDAKKGLLPDD